MKMQVLAHYNRLNLTLCIAVCLAALTVLAAGVWWLIFEYAPPPEAMGPRTGNPFVMLPVVAVLGLGYVVLISWLIASWRNPNRPAVFIVDGRLELHRKGFASTRLEDVASVEARDAVYLKLYSGRTTRIPVIVIRETAVVLAERIRTALSTG